MKHTHIAFVGGHPGSCYPGIHDRQVGYEKALANAHIDASCYADCHRVNTEEIVQVTTNLLQANPQVTAVFAANDEAAITVMNTLRSLGLQIPGDISVVGYGDIDLASRISPPLTTMQIDKAGMGAAGRAVADQSGSTPGVGIGAGSDVFPPAGKRFWAYDIAINLLTNLIPAL